MTTSKEVLPETITDEMVQDGFSQPLSQEIAKRYNNYSQLIDSNRELVSALIDAKKCIGEFFNEQGANPNEDFVYNNAQTAINNAKNIQTNDIPTDSKQL